MGKLHEVLAVEASKKNAFVKILTETRKVFKEKASLFQEFIRTLHLKDENAPDNGAQDRLAMTTTVPQRLNWTAEPFNEYVDVVLQKEAANQIARGTIDVDGLVIKNLPATFLLGLESKLAQLRAVLDEMPTLPAGVDWVPDSDHKFGLVFKAKYDEQTNKTRKEITPFVLYEATDKHPAQVEKLTEDKVIGTFETKKWSGAVTPARKAAILGRLDKLLEAVKVARQKANETEAPNQEVGKTLTDYILGADVVACGSGVDVAD